MRAFTILFALLPLLPVTSGCQRLQLDERVPADFQLTGVWRLDPVRSDRMPDQQTGLPGGRRTPRPGLLTFIAHDFPVLTAREITIEQNRDSMGMRFDGGAYRDVSWGERQRGVWEVVAGWKDGALVIVSEVRDQQVIETMTLEPGGRVLVVDLAASGRNETFERRRVFKR